MLWFGIIWDFFFSFFGEWLGAGLADQQSGDLNVCPRVVQPIDAASSAQSCSEEACKAAWEWRGNDWATPVSDLSGWRNAF